MKILDKIRIAISHARYHRYLKHAEQAKENKDIKKFKKYIYRAEDAWRKVVLITKKYNYVKESNNR
jgi:hypothetical protein